MKVVGVDRNCDGVKALSAKLSKVNGQLHAILGDVTKEEDVTRVVKWTRDTLKGADVLVNCAGVYHSVYLAETESDNIKRLLDVNVLGLSIFTREVIKCMRSRGVDDGHIIHMCSVTGQNIPDMKGVYFYSATKHAVRVLTEGLRRELRDLKTKIKITYYATNPHLEPKDIAEAVLFSLQTAPHVQIHDITINPVGA